MLANIVDIGDEYFNVTDATDTKSYDFICKSKKQFDKAFGPILSKHPKGAGLRVIRTYLPHGSEQLKNITEADKKILKAIIVSRMENLKSSEQHSNRRVINIQFDRYYKNLEKLLKKIDAATESEPVTPVSAVQKRIRDKFPKDRVHFMLIELAYYLLNPSRITTHSDELMKILDAVDKMTLGDFVKGMYDPAKHTTLVDVDRIEKAKVLDSSVFSPPDHSTELKRRLEAIMKLIQTKKFLKQYTSNSIGPDVTTTTIDILTKRIPNSSMAGGGEISNESLAVMMKPFYEFFEEQYGILPSILASDDGPALVTLSKLLFICQKIIQNKQHGIYRIVNLDKDLLSFLTQQLGAIQALDDEKKEEFAETAKLVPLLSVRSLMNKFGKSGHYNDPDHQSAIRFFIPGINLTLMEDIQIEIDPFQKEAIKKELTDYFVDSAIYLVCNEAGATETPMNVFEIDYNGVNVSKDTCEIRGLEDNHFNKFKEPALFLETLVALKPEPYNHGMLALSMFLRSEQLLPK